MLQKFLHNEIHLFKKDCEVKQKFFSIFRDDGKST